MFIDTSVFVALLAGEPDAEHLTARIENVAAPCTSGLVILEATMRLSTLLRAEPHDAEARLRRLLATLRITLLPIDGDSAHLAIEAFARFGKGRHRAALNLSDCLSYACARQHGLPLLFKGNDFSQTDIAVA